jgi:hypoxanthine phosphoribosyltransferase
MNRQFIVTASIRHALESADTPPPRLRTLTTMNSDPSHLDDIRHIRAKADCLASRAEVDQAISRMAEALHARLANANPLVQVVMNGGLIFAGQILPRLDFPLELSYLHATRYGHATRGHEVEWLNPPQENVNGRTVLLLDDVLDEGHTLVAIIDQLHAVGAREVLSAVLVEKHHAHKAHPDLRADFTGLVMPDRFLFGYGMDYRGYWRNAPGIYAIKE